MKDILNMSDEDFLKASPTSLNEEQDQEAKEPEDNEQNQEADTGSNQEPEQAQDDPFSGEDLANTTIGNEQSDNMYGNQEESSSEGKSEPQEGTSQTQQSNLTNDQYKAFYEQVMAPFKANGRMVELRSVDEVIKLMQKGANYTRKMQEIAQYRKIIMMLEENNLLNENQISFLIDIHNKNPQAIQKYFKDNGLDPFSVDTEAEPTYKPGSHRVSDEQYRFKTVLDEVSSSEAGVKTIGIIQDTWDDVSKDTLWKNPELMYSINEQIQSGVYKMISDEVDRMKTIGAIEDTVPFLEAYKMVGDAMLASQQDQQKPVPMGRGVYAPASVNQRAKSAASNRGNSNRTERFVNVLEMDDDEFLKQMSNRV